MIRAEKASVAFESNHPPWLRSQIGRPDSATRLLQLSRVTLLLPKKQLERSKLSMAMMILRLN